MASSWFERFASMTSMSSIVFSASPFVPLFSIELLPARWPFSEELPNEELFTEVLFSEELPAACVLFAVPSGRPLFSGVLLPTEPPGRSLPIGPFSLAFALFIKWLLLSGD